VPALSPKLSKVDDYPAFLDACWQEHLAPRAADAPTVVSTFAGAGGSSLGYSMAGFRELLAVEWDDNAVATFRLNFPDVPVYHGDIAKLSVDDVLRRTGLQPGGLDVFDGSPPCQGFSTAGKRDFYDDRNQLFREYVRLLRGLQPKVMIMENVSGMVKGKMKLVFADILRELKASGYRVSARLLNAMYFNVPQSRQRMIFVGVREDLGIEPSHPQAVSVPISVKAALVGVADDPTAFTVGAHTKIYQEMKTVKPGGHQPGHHSHVRLPLDKPSCALLADNGFGHYHFWHPAEHRTITFNELKVLASFSSHFVLCGEPAQMWARIGNSVPPLFMRSIALHVRREILSETPVLI
jgi:DNA (cytosine-5)-methyltransferase 1